MYLRRWRCQSALLVIALWGCQPTVQLMPVPLADKREYHELVPDDEKLATVEIGYATNRLSAPAGADRFYAKDFDQNLRFGAAYIQLGDDGDVDWEELATFSATRERGGDTPLHLTGIQRLGMLPVSASLDKPNAGTRRLMDGLNETIARKPQQHLTIYVHGANNNFYRATAQAAQFHHFAGGMATMVAFAWPSTENFIKYHRDVSNIKATVPVFVRFVELLARHTEAERIDILAYSAGAQLVAQSLAALGSRLPADSPEREQLRAQLRLGTVVFAAPDTSFNEFAGQLYAFADLVDNVTVTINEADYVLAISKRFGEGRSRLGAPDYEELDPRYANWTRNLTRSGKLDVIFIDTDVVPDIDAGAHDYWFNNNWVSTDMLALLSAPLSPAERGLRRVETEGWVAWYFPEDYDRHIDALYSQVLEALGAEE